MNIGLITDCYLPTKNGVATSAAYLYKGLARRGHHVVIVTAALPPTDPSEINVYRFPSVPFNAEIELRLSVATPCALAQIFRRKRLDLIHTHTEYTLGWAARHAAHQMRLPWIHTAHTRYEDYRHYLFFGRWVSPALIQRLFTRFLRGCDTLICPSIKARRYFQAFVPAVPMAVIGNGVCPARFNPDHISPDEREQTRQNLGIRPADQVMLYVGRLGKEKRVVELLTALIPLLQARPTYKLLIVGGGPCETTLRQIAQACSLQDQVIFTGYVDWEQMPRLYAAAQVFVTASLSEVHPMTLIEAAMSGLPLVARRDDSLTDLIHAGYNGVLAGCDAQIAAGCAKILDDEAIRRMFAQHSPTVAGRFTADIHVEKVETLYRGVLNR